VEKQIGYTGKKGGNAKSGWKTTASRHVSSREDPVKRAKMDAASKRYREKKKLGL
jgi:hypothetical protein